MEGDGKIIIPTMFYIIFVNMYNKIYSSNLTDYITGSDIGMSFCHPMIHIDLILLTLKKGGAMYVKQKNDAG